MKKILLISLCLFTLIFSVSCNLEADESSAHTTSNEFDSRQNPSENDLNLLDNDDEQFEENIPKDDGKSIQIIQHQHFNQFVDKNPYDQWLKNELAKGERAEKNIYAEYLAFWKEELTFTVDNAQEIFDDKAQYEQWKDNIEQWLVNAENILKIEMNSMAATLPQLEVIIPYCKLIRQKVIDTKKFLYYYEKEELGILDIHNSEILITWKYDN